MAIAGLGRAFDVVPIAAGVGLNFRFASGITFICTGADTFTLTVASTFGGSYTSPGSIFTYYYQAAATNGTAAWTKQTQSASNAVVQGSADTTAIELLETQLADPSCYVKMTASASGLVMAVFHDLDVQRKPANLVKLSA
jgi:hypothetical protein